MKILIVGGGVAGPALARFLKGKAEITLVDKAPQWGNIGYAITLWGNGEKILRELGVDQKVFKGGYEIPWSVFEDKKGKILSAFFFDIFHSYGPTEVVTRTALQQALVEGIESFANIRLGTTISEIKQDGREVTVTFSDGTADKFDLVAGCDGIHSVVREKVFGGNFLKYYGWSVCAFWTPEGFAPPKGSIEFASGGKICFIYPMEERAVVMLAIADEKKVSEQNFSKESLHALLSDFEPLVGHLIDAVADPAHIFHDDLAYVDMKNWYQESVVLLGDAKHAISPITGMGASMALEDAFVLGEELKSNMGDIPKALKNYEKRRDRRIKNFRKMSDFIESFMMVKSPFISALRDILLKVVPMSYFTRKIEKVLAEEI